MLLAVLNNLSIAMENFTGNYSLANSSELFEPLPIGAVAFAPFIFLELVIAIVSNVILLALVILSCVHKFNNSINIYLFSLSINGLMGALSVFCTFMLVLARRWVLGDITCVLNVFIFLNTNNVYLLLYLIISRHKYKIVKHYFSFRPSKKRAYILSAVAWIVSFSPVAVSSWNTLHRLLDHDNNENFRCYGFSSERLTSSSSFVFVTTFIVTFWLIALMIIIASLFYFIKIMLELRNLNKLRQRFSEQSHQSHVIKINEHNKPLYTTAEERTAKSLTLIFFIQLFALSVSYGMSYIHIIRNFVLPADSQESQDYQIYFIVILIAQLFPTTNAAYLILSNKRLRLRVKGLFKCQLNPYIGCSPAHRGAVITRKATRGTFSKSHAQSRVFPQPV